jgi:hypothetical protein
MSRFIKIPRGELKWAAGSGRRVASWNDAGPKTARVHFCPLPARIEQLTAGMQKPRIALPELEAV